jgi:hypothetical protein
MHLYYFACRSAENQWSCGINVICRGLELLPAANREERCRDGRSMNEIATALPANRSIDFFDLNNL